MKKLLIITLAIILAGCASPNYKVYTDSQNALATQHQLQVTAQATAKSISDTARFNALMKIAETGDSTAKVAAVMALQFGSQNNTQLAQQMIQIQAPQPNQLLQWASVLVPAVTQMYGIKQNAQVAINSSNNATAIAQSTNSTFAGMGNSIATTSANGNTANIAIAGAGVAALSNISTVGNTSLLELGKSSNTALTTLGTSSNTSLVELGKSSNDSLVKFGESSNTGITTVAVAGTTALTTVSSAGTTALTTVAGVGINGAVNAVAARDVYVGQSD